MGRELIHPKINPCHTQAMVLVHKVWAWNDLRMVHTKWVSETGRGCRTLLIEFSCQLPSLVLVLFGIPARTTGSLGIPSACDFPPSWGFCPYFAGLVPYWDSGICCTGFKKWNVARVGFLWISDVRAHPAKVWVSILSVQFMLYLCPWGKHQKSLLPQSSYWFFWTLQEYSSLRCHSFCKT